MMIVPICTLVGAVLGLRFNVMALVPAIGFGLLTTIVTGIARADGAWAIVGACAAVATVLQIGYLAGTLTRFTVASVRGARLRRASARTTSAMSGPAR